MTPLRLTFSAFGPYAGEQILDFAELRGAQFFLIHGPTGAGKTTVLDAMTYALYGESAGAGREGAQMRSHHANLALPTRVEFEFRIAEQRYRVTRAPEQALAKKRGEGTTRKIGEAHLERWHEGAWQPVCAQPRKVTEEIERLLGFSATQFRQVILIPQGRFREVLEADSKLREQILEKLFGTERFGRITDRLREMAGALRRENEDAEITRSTLLQQSGAETPEVLSAQIDTLAVRATTLANDVERLRTAALRATDRLAQEKALAERFAELNEARKTLAQVQARQPAIDANAKRLEAARRAVQVEAAQRLALTARQTLAAARDERAKAVSSLPAAERAVAKSAAELLQTEAQVERVTEARVLLPKIAADLATAQQQLSAARERTKLQAGLTRLVQDLAKAGQVVQQREGALTAAMQQRDAQQRLWDEGQAAWLAASLQPGSPCPVCGATDHPAPATDTHATPGEAQLRDARSTVDAAQAALDAARHALNEARLAHETRQTKLIGIEASPHTEDALAAAVRDLSAQHTATEKLAQTDGAALAGAKQAVAAAQQAVATAQERCRQLAEGEAKADTAVNEAQRELTTTLAAHGFADEAAWQAARLDAAGIAKLDGEIAGFRQQLAAAHDRVTQGEVVLRDSTAPDLTATETAQKQAMAEADAASRDFAAAKHEHERLVKLRADLAGVEKHQAMLSERYGVVGKLADGLGGKNPHGLTLQRFVLAAFLDDTLLAASARLHRMSRGRYTLARKLGRDDERRAGGLDLEVFDAYTGQPRDVTTLSGGEGFLASLALALGLADVVQSYAGGRRLDALFIDEGFGTLDPEALDEAMRALLDLQEGGRLVGIISHVPELRERIDVRLEVTAGRNGSTARFVAP